MSGNQILNPIFETNTNNWTESPATSTRITNNVSELGSNSPLDTQTSLKIVGGTSYNLYTTFVPFAGGTGVGTVTRYLRYNLFFKTSRTPTPPYGISPITIRVVDNSTGTYYFYLTGLDDSSPRSWTKYAGTLSGLIDTTMYRFSVMSASTLNPSDAYYLTDVYIGSDSSVLCFNKGTKILSLRDGIEMYIPIEELDKEKDLVKTYLNGFKKISGVKHMILNNNPEDFTSCMYIMEKQRDMIDDLVVSGGHSILEDSYESTEAEKMHKELFGGEIEKIDNKVLVLAGKSSKFKQIKNKEIFDIYHIALEGENDKNEDKRYGIWANGVLTESTYKKVLYKSLNLF